MMKIHTRYNIYIGLLGWICLLGIVMLPSQSFAQDTVKKKNLPDKKKKEEIKEAAEKEVVKEEPKKEIPKEVPVEAAPVVPKPPTPTPSTTEAIAPAVAPSSPPTTLPVVTDKPKTVKTYYTDYSHYDNNGEKKVNPFSPRTLIDTTKPYVADASYLPIVSWDSRIEEELEGQDTLSISPRVASKKDTPTDNVIANLDDWRIEAKVFSVPFQVENAKMLQMTRYFDLPSGLRDSVGRLYLYFEGIAWRAEVKMNGKFLGIHESAFEAWEIPLNTKWLREDDNLLEVTLSTGEGKPFYPQSFLGIFRPAYILTEQQLHLLHQTKLPKVANTQEKVAIVVPYYGKEHQYIFDKFEAIRTLVHIQRKGIRHVHFLLPPDQKLKDLYTQAGMIEVLHIKPEQEVAWMNRYPYLSRNFLFSDVFWLDENQQRTQHYEQLYPYSMTKVWAQNQTYNPLHVLGLLISLLGMFLIKIINPNFYYSLGDILIKPRLQVERFMEITYGNQGLMTLLLAIRLLIVSMTFALFISYLHQNNQWELLGRMRENYLIQLLFPANGGFLHSLWVSVLLVSVWTVFRGILLRTLSRLYKIFHMYEGLTNLELLGSYPLVFILPLPLLLLSVSASSLHQPLFILQVLLTFLYVGRQVYVCFIGMDRLFKFSVSVKLLYILLVVIFPYILCL